MNDEQLKRAAIKYCELLGIDPMAPDYSRTPRYTGPNYGNAVYPPQWEGLTYKIREAAAILEAIKYVQSEGS